MTDPDDPVASKLNSLPKYVASNTLENPEWAGTTVLSGDVPKQVAELKSRPGGELQVHGSGKLAQTLIEHGLVDTYNLLTFPLVLGYGQRLFDGRAKPAGLRLTSSQKTSSGIVIDVYEAAGEPELGSFELE